MGILRDLVEVVRAHPIPDKPTPEQFDPWYKALDRAGNALFALSPQPEAGDGWRSIESAPVNREVEVQAGAMTFLAMLAPGASMDEDERPCDQWQATREGEHPPCWSGGSCWASNEDENLSLQPTRFRFLPAPPVPAGEDARP